VYVTITKWIFALTLPLFLILFLFPKIVLGFFFGPQYTSTALPLQILVLGFFFHSACGPNGNTLISMEKQKTVALLTGTGVILNVILNWILIPIFGMAGAAFATASVYILTNILLSAKIYSLTKMHPFTKNYFKPLIISAAIIALIYLLTEMFLVIQYWMLPILFIIFLLVYGAALFLTKSFDSEDVELMKIIIKKLKLNFLQRIVNFIERRIEK
jgi:O-antigen/teichoic acid export membrane protein